MVRFVLFGAFGTIWLPYETRCKWAKLVQKFVPRRCVGIFRNKHTRFTPLDPKMTFCCVLYYLSAFGTVWLPYRIRCKTGRTNASCHEVASEFFAMNAPDPPHWTLSRHFGSFRTIWVHSGPFGCLTKHGAKRTELVQKSSCHEVAPELFATNAPDPPDWTLS